MRYVAFVVLLLAGCSTVDVDAELAKKVPHPEQRNFLKALVAGKAACEQFDATSVQVCQVMTNRINSLPDPQKFIQMLMADPNSLTSDERLVMQQVTQIGAAYADLKKIERAEADQQRFWNSLAAGAAVGALLAPPRQTQQNCQVYNAHTPTPFVQCYIGLHK